MMKSRVMQVKSSGENVAVVLLTFEVDSVIERAHAIGLDTFYMLMWSCGCMFACWRAGVIVASFASFARTQGRLNNRARTDTVHKENGTKVMRTWVLKSATA